MILMLVGCAMLEKQANDPESPLSKAVTVIDTSAHAVKDAAPAAGPYGWIAGAVATVVVSATGIYKVRQKNREIDTDGKIITAQQREFQAVRDTTKAIVDAIEDVSKISMGSHGSADTIGDIVKEKVSEELKKKNLDTIGKAIITGIKAARNEESAQKM